MSFTSSDREFFWSSVALAPPVTGADFSLRTGEEGAAWMERQVVQANVLALDAPEPYLNFRLTAAGLSALLAALPGPGKVLIDGHLRDAQVARTLREPRRQLRRWQQLVAPGLQYIPTEVETAPNGPWRGLAIGLLGLAVQLHQNHRPWAPVALAQVLGRYLDTWREAWNESVLDGDGPEATDCRLRLLAKAHSFTAPLLPQLVP